jgi:glycosyltransferase involved in cell wall biosynthesis
MLLSIYTCVRDGLYHDYHVVQMIRHHLPFADEIVVHDGNSTDGTAEAIAAIGSDKVKLFRSDWGKPTGLEWIANFKNAARKRCRGRWAVNLDCDEFIPEWDFEAFRRWLEDAPEGTDVLPLRMMNFYGSYRVYHRDPVKVPWPDVKWNVHRNRPDIEVYGDGSNVRRVGEEVTRYPVEPRFTCHHFGFVRNPARLRQKWRNVLANLYSRRHGKRANWFALPSLLFDLFPHRWKDPQFLPDLAVYDGPHVAPVRDDPAEFTRDRGEMYDYLTRQAAGSAR